MESYVIKCKTLIDGTGGPIKRDVGIVVRNEHIVRVEESSEKIPTELPVIDATKYTVIPGIIDSHKHVMNCGGAGMGIGLNYSQLKDNIFAMSKGGVTSALDLGASNMAPLLEKMIGSHTKIFNAISIVTCKGGYPQEYMHKKFYNMGAVIECDGFDDIEKVVKKLYKKGVAVIKTAVVSRTFDNRPQKNWTNEELQYLTDKAHSYGLNVCAHITYEKDYEQAALCGVDSIHHASFDSVMKEDIMKIMIERGIIFVPTLSLATLLVKGLKEKWYQNHDFNPRVNEEIKENLKDFTYHYNLAKPNEPIKDFFIRVTKKEMELIPSIQFENVRKYIAMGGTVAMGTDSALGFSFHDTPVCEIQLLNKAGLSLEETIKASTLNSAKVFGMDHEIGCVKEKMKADLLIIDGDLRENITKIRNIKEVIINGKLISNNFTFC